MTEFEKIKKFFAETKLNAYICGDAKKITRELNALVDVVSIKHYDKSSTM